MTTPPAILPDGIYSGKQVVANLGISPNTLASWVYFNGLGVIQPGTSRRFYLGRELIDFMVKHRAGGVRMPRTAKERAEIAAQMKGGAE